MHKKSVKNFHQLLLNFIFLLDFAGNTRTAHSTRAIRRARCIISTRRVSQVEKNNSRTFSHRVSNSMYVWNHVIVVQVQKARE